MLFFSYAAAAAELGVGIEAAEAEDQPRPWGPIYVATCKGFDRKFIKAFMKTNEPL